jgi:adenosylhomocysteine nucleosidase
MKAKNGPRSEKQRRDQGILVCFAVREEAEHLLCGASPQPKVIITGIGGENARRSLLEALESFTPRLVLTCGYAGGLNPQLRCGDILFDAEADSDLTRRLINLGARPGTFYCANRIAVFAAEKCALRTETQADAIEMESGVIRLLCRERGIAAATIRVISDDAVSDLPLDFNQLSRPDGSISYRKLAAAVARAPGAILRLMRFRRELGACSTKLAATLNDLLRAS